MNEEEKKLFKNVQDMFENINIKNIDEQSITIYGTAILDVIKALTIIEKQQKKIEILEQNYGVAIEQNKTYKANIYDLKKRNKNLDKGLNNSSGNVTELARENTKLRYEQLKNKEKIKELESDNYECNNIIIRYMEELEIKDKMIDLMSEHLTTPIHSKKDVIKYFENLAKESGEIDEGR